MLNERKEFTDELHNRIVMMIDADVSRIVSDRSGWMGTLSDIYDNYMGVPDSSRALPWENASNIHVPMTMIASETTHPRILSGLIGIDEIVTYIPGSAKTVDLCRDTSGVMNWAFRTPTQINGLPILDKITHKSELYGKAISKLVWEHRERETCKLYTRPRYSEGTPAILRLLSKLGPKIAKSVKPQQLEVPYQQHISQLIGPTIVRFYPLENKFDRTVVRFRHLIDDELREGYAEIPVPGPLDLDIDIFLYADTVIKDAPTITNVPLADFLCPVDAGDLQDTKCNIHRYWLTLDDLSLMRDKGLAYFDEDLWDRLVKDDGRSQTQGDSTGGESRPKSRAAMEEDGVRSQQARIFNDSPVSDVQQGFEVLECFYTFRMPGQANPVEWVFYDLPSYSWIFRAIRMEVLCPHNRRPFTSWDFMYPDDDDAYCSIGLGHITMDLQAIINDIFNDQMDRDALINMPFGFYKPTSQSVKDLIKIAPGVFIPSSNPQDFVIPTWNRPPAADTPYIQMILQFMERLTSASNYFQGGAPSTPNAPRTFGATAAILQEGQINYDLHIKRYQGSLIETFEIAKNLYAHFKRGKIEFMAPGASTLSTIDVDTLRENYGVLARSNAQNTNRAIQQQFNAILFQSLIQSPLFMTDITAMYNLTRRFALAHDYLEFDRDVPRPAQAMSHAPMDQIEEIEYIRFGTNIVPLPMDNHEEHVQVITQYMKGELGLELPPEAIPVLIGHLTMHQQMMAMMQRAQMVSGQGGATNPSMGGPGGVGSPNSEQQIPGGSPSAGAQAVGNGNANVSGGVPAP
jgi:hypothetical protein